MKKITFLMLMLLSALSFGSGALAAVPADDDYNPANPAEPTTIDYCRLTVKADPEEGAYVSGGGRYNVGTSGRVYISTSARNTEDYTYTFLYWTKNGVQYSTSRNFYYTPEKGDVELVAHYQKDEVIFDPSNPNEPNSANIKKKYYLFLESNLENSCSFNIASGDKKEEKSQIYLRVYPDPYYRFLGWQVDGQTVSTSTSFYYTMPSANTTIMAMLEEIPYDPESPIDPPANGKQEDIDNTTLRGDVNGDKAITVADLVGLIQYVVNKQKPEKFNMKNADVDGNGVPAKTDIEPLVNLILAQ